MEQVKKAQMAYLMNALVIVFEVIGLSIAIINHKAEAFIYYTELSNLFCLLVSMTYVIYYHKHQSISRGIEVLRYISVTCQAVVFIVVVAILAPWISTGEKTLVQAYVMMLTNNSMLFTHTICPTLTFISFLFYENLPSSKKIIWLSGIPTMIYGVVSLWMNYLRIWYGPYPFLYVYEQPIYMSVIWYFVICGGSLLIGLGLYKLKNKQVRDND